MVSCYYSACWYLPGDYSWISDTTERIQHSIDYQAVNLDGWDTLYKCKKIIITEPIIVQIKEHMYQGHTNESRLKSLKTLEFIAKNGWYRYVWLCLWDIKTPVFYEK